MLWKKSVILEVKHKPHSSENFFGKRSGQEYIREGLGGNLENKDKAVKYFQNTRNKCKREIKALKKNKKYIMAKHTIFYYDLKFIKNIRSKVSKYESSISDSSSRDFYSYLYSDTKWDEIIKTDKKGEEYIISRSDW